MPATIDGAARRSWRPSALLLVLAAALLAVTAWASAALHAYAPAAYVASHIVHATLYAIGVGVVLIWRPQGRALTIILAAALAMRLAALFVPPTLTTDAFRYVWDGRVQAEGINPYLYVPADERLAHLRDDAIFPHINRAETHPTIYPPVAEMTFLLGTTILDSIRGQQIVMLIFDLIAIGAILGWLTASGLPRERIVIYAWHPLTVWEFAGMAHIDAAAVAFLSLALLAGERGRQALAGFAFAAAGLVKYHFVLFVPAVWRRWTLSLPLAMITAAIAFYTPYLSAGPKLLGSLFTHLGEEGYKDGYGFFLVALPRHFGLPFIPPPVFAGLAAVALAAIGLAAVMRAEPAKVSPHYLLLLAAAFLLLVSPHYPWYYAMILPLMCRAPYPPLLWASLVVSLVYLDTTPILEPYTRLKVFTAMFGGFAVLAAAQGWWERRRRVATRASVT